MKNPFFESFEIQLTSRREALLARLREQRGGALGRAEAAAISLAEANTGWAQADPQRDLDMGLQEREAAELVAIEAALQRIQDGSYGLCQDCGADIPAARLHSQPSALRCVACQERLEQSHGAPLPKRL